MTWTIESTDTGYNVVRDFDDRLVVLQTASEGDARRYVERLDEELAAVSAERRKAAKKNGDTMPDGSYPITNQSQANKAWNLRNHSKTYSEQQIVSHIRSQCKKHDLKMPGGD